MSGEGKITSIKTLAGNVPALRLSALAVSLCLVPAFMLGVVSVWSIVFAIIIGLHFRAGLLRLNQDIDRTENYSGIKYRLWFLALCLESIVYMTVSFSVFYAIYVRQLLNWPSFTGFRFDDVVGFFGWIPAISFSDIASPYQQPALYAVSTASMLAYFTLVSLLAIAGRSWWGFGVRTMKPIITKKSHYGGMKYRLSGIFATNYILILVIIINKMNYFSSELFLNIKILNENSYILILNFFIFYFLCPFVFSSLLLSASLRFSEAALNLGRSKNERI